MEVGGKGEYNYTYRYTVNTRMTCIKMGSDESHFNVSLIVRDKVTRPCLQTATVEEKGDPKRYRTEVPSAYHPDALPLGQTGSQSMLQKPVIRPVGVNRFKGGNQSLHCHHIVELL